jgi:CRP-like cAMP-binding protein
MHHKVSARVTIMANPRIPERNRLLGSLPADHYTRLAPSLEVVRLGARQVLSIPGQTIEHVYFPRDAVVTLLVPMENGTGIEGATVGNEGLIGLQIALGAVTATEEVVVQIEGDAVQVSRIDFRQALESSPPLRGVVSRYTLALMTQFARTAACNRLHSVRQRCARWLLMSRDRVGHDTFAVTHEGLALLLGARRASISEVAEDLRRTGIIEYRRGLVTHSGRGGTRGGGVRRLPLHPRRL